MISLIHFWKNLAISKKLYFVVGVMAILIAMELLTLRFAVHTLSGARAFISGESVWSKAQKDAAFSLQRYGITRNESDYLAFLEYLRIPEGDHRARAELLKPNPNLTVVRAGFIQGHIHPDAIDSMVDLLRKFYWTSYLSRAIQIWGQGDGMLDQFRRAGVAYHSALVLDNSPHAKILLGTIKSLNGNLTALEGEFSSTLGAGSRWLEHVVLTVLLVAVLMVESVGLTLTFLTSRSISRGLRELSDAANRIGQGDFLSRVEVRSRDEIGILASSVNNMGELLQSSYDELESRVHERTAELTNMAMENARLYEEAKTAIQIRDEFLSIASHELRTPLTALYFQLQTLSRSSRNLPEPGPATKKIEDLADMSLWHAKRLTMLLDKLLDLTRLRLGKLEVNIERCDLARIAADVTSQFSNAAVAKGLVILLRAKPEVMGFFDPIRISQVMTNLISNAIRYGNGKPIEVILDTDGEKAVFSVRDHGVGIPADEQEKIFERFERGSVDPNTSGLGLGLYISREIIKAHGGSISVESTPGAGSEFRFELALAQASPFRVPAKPQTLPPEGPPI